MPAGLGPFRRKWIETGDYGDCHLCDRPIPVRRLRIVPHTRYCGPCHQLKEGIS